MSICWIIGRKVTMTNGHDYMAEPFIVFDDKAEAEKASNLIEKISGERPKITEAARYVVSGAADQVAP